jgi:lipopolysaccharide transport system ATP-binding protein
LLGQAVNTIVRAGTYLFKYSVIFDKLAANVRFGMLVKTVSGVELGGGITTVLKYPELSCVESGSVFDVEFVFCCSLNPGVYFLNAGVLGSIDDNEMYLHRILDCVCFRVIDGEASSSNGFVNFDIFPRIRQSA